MSDIAFARAQREYDNQTPPEAPESCAYHNWEWSEDEPNVESCPDCEAAADDYYETLAEERRHGIY